MKLYISMETRNEGATKNINEKVYITINNIEDLEQSVIDYFLKNRTRATLLSFNLVARLDGSCDTIEKKYYQKQLLKVIAGKGKI